MRDHFGGELWCGAGSTLYYFAVPDDREPYKRYAEAMDMLLEMVETMPEEEKIRIVSVSHGVDVSQSGASEWQAAIARAEEQGIIVVYPGMPELSYTGAGCPPGLDRDDPANYRRWSWTLAKEHVLGRLLESGVSSFETAREELKRLLTSDPELNVLHVEAIHTYLYVMELARMDPEHFRGVSLVNGDSGPDTLSVPADYLTVGDNASPSAYTYFGNGGQAGPRRTLRSPGFGAAGEPPPHLRTCSPRSSRRLDLRRRGHDG